jgi:ribosomal protein S18 acetylase RimI-like enzyme
MGLKWTRVVDASASLERALSFLLKDEVENTLALGMLERETLPGPPALLVLGDRPDGTVGGLAIMTPPAKLVVTRLDDDDAGGLVESLAGSEGSIPGVIAPERTAEALAARWAPRLVMRRAMTEDLYRLQDAPAVPAATGALRLAAPADEPILTPWVEAFAAQALIDLSDARVHAQKRIAQKQLFVWDDGRPVSMAAFSGKPERMARVGLVYTPPECRGLGYATACVAALSARLIGTGRSCLLFADRSNPVSTGIYRKLGYRQVAAFAEYRIP